MVRYSCKDAPHERLDIMDQRGSLITLIFGILMGLSLFCSTVYFYIIRRKRDKPGFLTVIFTLLIIVWFTILWADITYPDDDFRMGSEDYWR